MQKLLYITPHLSTGGAPQYLLKKIELLKDEYDISLVEYTDLGGTAFVVQKNRIFDIIPPEKRVTLGEDKTQLLDFLDKVQPDIVHLEEIPELFMDKGVAEILYDKNRKYTIFETSHDSSQNPRTKQFFPDKFMFVSQWQIDQYKNIINIPSVLVEYPIEYKENKNREEACKRLGLDPNKKHIIHVGLFTPRKNQAEFFEYAKTLPEYEFHCIGNQADNFKHYWEPLMKNKPDNLTWWGERNDVDNFYEAADLFLFTSKGNSHDKETMPLVIREALSWKLPILIYNLEVYQDYFNSYPVEYLTQFDENIDKIKSLVDNTYINLSEEAFILSTYPNSQAVIDTTFKCIESIKKIGRKIILVSHYPIPESLQKEVDHCIYDSNNVLVKHTWYNKAWWDFPDVRFDFNLKGEDNDWYHGPAVYTNYYNGSQLAEKLGFKKIYFLNFDYFVKNKKDIDFISRELNTHDAVLSSEKNIAEGEGDTYETFFMAFNSSYYNKIFPLITSGEEYNTWASNAGSNSNGLERSMYCTLQNKGKHLAIHRDKIWGFFDFADFSQTEYFTVLPSNKPNTIIPVVKLGDSTSTKKLTINVKDLDSNILKSQSFNIHGRGCFWFEFDKNTNNSSFVIEHVVEDTIINKVTHTKTIKITPEYLKSQIQQNGMVSFKNLPNKVKLIHLVTEPETNPKEIRSVSSIKDFCQKSDIVYEQQINEIWPTLPPKENCNRPNDIADNPGHYKLAPGHYGCFLAHKNAICNEDNKNYDYVLIFEGDAIIDSDYQELKESLKRFSKIAEEQDQDLIGFGNPHQYLNSNSTKVEDIFTNVTSFVPAHSYLINKSKLSKISKLFNTTKWDAFDLWICNVAKLKAGISEKIYTKQLPGFSIIDQKHRGINEILPEVYITE